MKSKIKRTVTAFFAAITCLIHVMPVYAAPVYAAPVQAEPGRGMPLQPENQIQPVDTTQNGISYYRYQWALKNTGSVWRGASEGSEAVGSLPGEDINVEAAWNVYEQHQERRPVTVAIIDTGVNIGHGELQNSLWINEDEVPGDGVDNDGNGYVDDINGWNFFAGSNQVFTGSEDEHGTHGAGTVAAAWDGQGVTGIADGNYVKIMVLKVLGTETGTGVSDNVKNAIRYAQENGADICNLSMGSYSYDGEMDALISNSSMLFVVSAGNGDGQGRGDNIDERPVFPAAYSSDNVITVANLMFHGALYESSNYGSTSVDIAAPGTYILSTTTTGYGFMTGTSMAAPMVTGVAALVYSCRTDLDLSGVRRAILDSARKSELLQGRVASGGVLDAYGAITYGIR